MCVVKAHVKIHQQKTSNFHEEKCLKKSKAKLSLSILQLKHSCNTCTTAVKAIISYLHMYSYNYTQILFWDASIMIMIL